MYFLVLKELFKMVKSFATFAVKAFVLLTTYSILHNVGELVLENILDGFIFVGSLDESGVKSYAFL